MKRLLIFCLSLFIFFIYSKPLPVFAVCGEEGDICCENYDPIAAAGTCNGDLTCDLLVDIGTYSLDPSNPDYSRCISIPCGHEGQPCCQNETTCLDEGLVCESSLSTKYSTICSYPQGTNLNDPYCTHGVASSGINTALGCLKVGSGSDLVTLILKIATGLGGGLALLLILYGVFIVTTSAGNPDKLKSGSEIITSAVIGLLFILLSVFLVNLIGINILGIPGLT